MPLSVCHRFVLLDDTSSADVVIVVVGGDVWLAVAVHRVEIFEDIWLMSLPVTLEVSCGKRAAVQNSNVWCVCDRWSLWLSSEVEICEPRRTPWSQTDGAIVFERLSDLSSSYRCVDVEAYLGCSAW